MNRKKIVGKTTEYIFYGITAVQVMFGFAWAICQFPHMQNWQETYEYLDISRTWVMDEYVSFLYPMFLRVCTGIENLAGVPFYMPMYVIQLAVAMFAGWFFARKVLKLEKSKAVWAVGYLTSFPLLLQFHMSIRVESLCVSGVFLLIALKNELKMKSEAEGAVLNIRKLFSAFVLTLFLVWLLPDMIIICGVVWVLFLVESLMLVRKKAAEWSAKKFALCAGAFVMALVIAISVNVFVQTPGSRGRIQKTFWAAAFQRVVTDYFSKSFGMWDEEVKITYTMEDAMELAKRSDNMMYVVGPALESDWGKERANELYRQMTLVCFKLRTKAVVYQIRDDLFDSLLMPFSTWWQDDGERYSQTGWNYERFRGAASVFARTFWEFSILALYVLDVIVITGIFRKKTFGVYVAVSLCLGGTQVALNTILGNGSVNYANAFIMIMFWCVLACTNVIKDEENS